jgi:hypothetical protein
VIRLGGATPRRGSAADFENAAMEHRRRRLWRRSWEHVDCALRADDIVHETQGMRSSNDFKPECHRRGLTGTMPA